MQLRKNIYLHRSDKIALGIAAAGTVAALGLFAYMNTRPAKPAKPRPLETYKGLGIYVTKDGAAYRWTVKSGTVPLATGLSVMHEEARISAHNWIDMTGAGK